MTETKSYELKEVMIRTSPDQEWQGLSPEAFRVPADRWVREQVSASLDRILGGTVTISATEAEYDPGVMEMWLERINRQMVDAMLKGIDAHLAEGNDIGLVIVPEEWEKRLPGLEAGLAERDIRLHFMPYMAKQDGFYLISRAALEGNLPATPR